MIVEWEHNLEFALTVFEWEFSFICLVEFTVFGKTYFIYYLVLGK